MPQPSPHRCPSPSLNSGAGEARLLNEGDEVLQPARAAHDDAEAAVQTGPWCHGPGPTPGSRVRGKTFTEWVPSLPPRCRITARVREQAAHEVTERGITPAEAARHAGISWPVAPEACAAAADPVLDQPVPAVAHLCIDEHRRGTRRYALHLTGSQNAATSRPPRRARSRPPDAVKDAPSRSRLRRRTTRAS